MLIEQLSCRLSEHAGQWSLVKNCAAWPNAPVLPSLKAYTTYLFKHILKLQVSQSNCHPRGNRTGTTIEMS
jgi:hypothetical protein